MRADKKAIAMPFNWIFALIVGGVILFLAIYVSSKFLGTSEKIIHTETASQLSSLLDPFETGLASGKSSQVNFKKNTKVYFECDEFSNRPFGKQTIRVGGESIGGTTGEEGERIPVRNKYVFAEDVVEGKKLYVFSKPFFMPFKISDLIIISSENYCFYDAPDEVKTEIQGLNLDNIIFTDNECNGKSVCFGSGNCDINIQGYCDDFNCESEYDYGKINNRIYAGNLLYAGIFSSEENYECNVKRIMNRFKELSSVYLDKIRIIERYGCSSNVRGQLMVMMNSIDEGFDSGRLLDLYRNAKQIDLINENVGDYCKLFENENN